MMIKRSEDWLYAAGLFLLALVIRLIFLAQIEGQPYFETLLLDPQAYDIRAQEILGGDWLGKTVFYQDPLYPYFLAIVYKIFGIAAFPVRLIQIVLGSLNAVLVYFIGKRLGGRRVGILTGALFLVYGLFCFYDGVIGKDGPGLFLINLALLALFWAAARERPWPWLLAGLTFGLAALTRGNLLLITPLIALWIFLVPGPKLSKRFVLAVCFILGLVLIISPVTIRNWVVGRDLVLTTAQAGQNFYIGNNPRAGGFFENPKHIRLEPQYEEDDFRQEALRLTGRQEMKPSEISSFWMRQGLKFIWENPGRALELFSHKTAMFFNNFEVPDNYNYYFAKEQAPLLKWLPLSFGLTVSFGLIGLALLWPDRRRFSLAALFFLGYLISIAPFHMAARYRMPVTLLLLCGTAITLWWVYDRLRAKQWPRLILAVIPLAILITLSHWPFYSPAKTMDSPYTTLGIAAAQTGDHEKAAQYYKQALEVNPKYIQALYNLGNSYLAQEKYDLAKEQYLRTLSINPEFIPAYLNLGKIYLDFEHFETAQTIFEKAIKNNPLAAKAYVGLGLSLHSRKRFQEARDAYDKALALQPAEAEAHYNLACVLAQLNLVNEAWKHLRTASRLRPDLALQAPKDPDLNPLGSPEEIRKQLK
ncbi:MAG: tetratricopeptide repeat protein [Deltaproteobacteria bacterium]|nr:tetratricopeptide repeat protein [Deltaproteobacteria bacterium]MBW2050792.1 tetratricopeptide repeat protein [Deltaproteobacteria bacterium]MBW2139541.1 tetratricopeptide repeat protein [Deltaproteobacteria bacterium]MBW2321944.1 tetratricopeptide repeat protein [Deltaproteobacteria bacterium]